MERKTWVYIVVVSSGRYYFGELLEITVGDEVLYYRQVFYDGKPYGQVVGFKAGEPYQVPGERVRQVLVGKPEPEEEASLAALLEKHLQGPIIFAGKR